MILSPRAILIFAVLLFVLTSHANITQADQVNERSLSPALRLWHEVEPLVVAHNELAVRVAISRDAHAARALYRELLFDAVDSRLYNNPPISPHADRLRTLLAQTDAESGALEIKFTAWSKERKLGEGFTSAGDGLEQVLYLYIAAEPKNAEKQEASAGTKPPTSRELTERARQVAESIKNELAIASCSSNLAYYALQERRRDDIRAPLQRAEEIWKRWEHPIGLVSVAFITAESHAIAEDWKEAARTYEQATKLAMQPELRHLRIVLLGRLAWSRRNSGDKQGVLDALMAQVAEQQKEVDAATDSEKRSSLRRSLADQQIELGGALAALNRHGEAGEWYARADRVREENYRIERAKYAASISEWEIKLKAAQTDTSFDAERRKFEISRATLLIDTWLTLLSNLAAERHDLPTLAMIAERRLASARQIKDRDKIADALMAVAKAHHAANNFEKARAAAEEALTLRSADPRRQFIYSSVELLGDIAYHADDLREAEARYREVIKLTTSDALPSPYLTDAEPNQDIRHSLAKMNAQERISRVFSEVNAHIGIANILQRKGNYSEAEREFVAAAASIPKLYGAGAEDERELLRWINELRGKAASGTNPDPASQIKSSEVAEHRRQTGLTVNKDELERMQMAELIANSLRANLAIQRAGLLDDQGDLDGAAKAYEAAITQITNILGGAFPLTGAYLALARIERERGNYAAAESPLATALAENQRQHDASGVAGVLAQTSELRRQQGRLKEARQLAEDALKIARTVGSRPQMAGILRTLGRAESEQGGDALKNSEQHLRQALTIWRDMDQRAHIAYTLSNLGLTLERMNRDAEALVSYEEAVRLVESLTSSLSKDVSADTFNSTRASRELYERLIKLLIKRGRTDDALRYLERAKSKALVDALAGAQVNAQDPAMKALLDRARTLSDSVRVAEKALATELAKPEEQRDGAKIADARARLAGAQKQYLESVEQIKRANPSYASLVAVNPTNLVEVRQRLPEKTLLLEYFPTDTELYIFVVTRDQAPVIRTVNKSRAELARLVTQYREALHAATVPALSRGLLLKTDGKKGFKPDLTLIKDVTVRLYDALLAPVQAEIAQSETLLIVPAAELYYLPIHALGRLNQDGSLSFLIEQKRFAYLASADLLNVVTATATSPDGENAPQASKPLLALGNPDGSLPAATEEVSALGGIFRKADVYTGNEATIARLAQPSARIPFIHFATHGMINTLDPKESYLLLAGNPNRLSVKDIVEDTYKLSFEGTRLVTLSACDTNIGGWDPSAVYSSLSRAFSKAGAPTVVASLWSVNDASTRDTMTVFYQELAAGQSKAEALRRAQLAVMRDPRFAHPFYWAPFVILGEWR